MSKQDGFRNVVVLKHNEHVLTLICVTFFGNIHCTPQKMCSCLFVLYLHYSILSQTVVFFFLLFYLPITTTLQISYKVLEHVIMIYL